MNQTERLYFAKITTQAFEEQARVLALLVLGCNDSGEIRQAAYELTALWELRQSYKQLEGGKNVCE